ncbi:MAG TPA: cyclic 2,3-diphosphoglycerate synthase [Rhodocyclaceae bacterium]|nr:cyclic 2,3-diphosphoglycerate synthase [Rhodocyclaceae bacterium]
MTDIRKVIILGAAGRDFHNFNTCYRDDSRFAVVAFTAAQIPDIAGRRYPPELAGPLYPGGIPIHPESALPRLIREHGIDVCMFAYSDVPYAKVMETGAVVNAAGADFVLAGPRATMLASTRPVVAVVATRTGAGKSQTCRRIVADLAARGLRVVTVRHPMPYGDLAAQRVQRFATLDDLVRERCTVEEMEEYEPHIERGNVVYAGVDYEAVLRAAETDPAGCDVIVWDGGNNDYPFFRPDLTITVADPHRAGHELSYYAGELNLRLADVVVINKIDTAPEGGVETVRDSVARVNPGARVVLAASPLTLDRPQHVAGKRVLVVEDGPTLTHGGMRIGAGTLAARRFGADAIIDPRPFAVGRIATTYASWPDIGAVLPAMGYGAQQLADLEATIDACPCDAVVIGTPVDLTRVIPIAKPTARVHYELEEIGHPDLHDVLDAFVREHGLT